MSDYTGRVNPSTETTPVSRTAYHHGDLKEALLSEAMAQLRAHGADGVSLRQVAQAVGVSPSAAYAHFPDKSALMAAVGMRGMRVLDERMVRAAAPVGQDDDAASVARFLATGTAYVRFALEEPHLFRHVFGPACALLGAADVEAAESGAGAYQVLCERLDDLEQRGLLRPGVREGLDLVAWTMVHGYASLVLDGLLPTDAGPLLLDALGRLALGESAQRLLSG